MRKLKLKDGRTIQEYDPTIREFVDATAMVDGEASKSIAGISSMILVDGKKITVEQFRNTFRMDDFMKIQEMFGNMDIDMKDVPFPLSDGKVLTLNNPTVGELMDRMTGPDNIDKYGPVNTISAMICIDDKSIGITNFLDSYKLSDYIKIQSVVLLPKN